MYHTNTHMNMHTSAHTPHTSCHTPQVQAIYSPLFVSEKGLLVFDQLPWFSVAERLEAEKAVMVEERAKFEQMMLEQQVGRQSQSAPLLHAHVDGLGGEFRGQRWGAGWSSWSLLT